MIYVAVGTQKFQFNRLLKEVDELVERRIITEPVFAQIGNSDYVPQNYSFQNFLSRDEFETKVKECSLLITHSGVATIMAGAKNNKPIVVVPRLAKYGEHVDDHQKQIAKMFAEQNIIVACEEDGSLKDALIKAKSNSFSRYNSQRQAVVDTIREFLSSI